MLNKKERTLPTSVKRGNSYIFVARPGKAAFKVGSTSNREKIRLIRLSLKVENSRINHQKTQSARFWRPVPSAIITQELEMMTKPGRGSYRNNPRTNSGASMCLVSILRVNRSLQNAMSRNTQENGLFSFTILPGFQLFSF